MLTDKQYGNMTYLPFSSSLSATGYKLRGKTLHHLVVNSWAYHCLNWMYVTLSRVTTLKGLIFNEELDETQSYDANLQSLRWVRKMRNTIGKRTLKDSGPSDYRMLLLEEKYYNASDKY